MRLVLASFADSPFSVVLAVLEQQVKMLVLL